MIRIGHGFDLHRTSPGRSLVLGGVTIPSELGLIGHSDADVLLHAVTDAVLGALALGDIGQWFPDSNEAYRGISSVLLLENVLRDARVQSWQLGNLDVTILAEKPYLAPHIPRIRDRVASLLGADASAVSVKATTVEGTDAIGAGKAMAVHAVIVLCSRGCSESFASVGTRALPEGIPGIRESKC